MKVLLLYIFFLLNLFPQSRNYPNYWSSDRTYYYSALYLDSAGNIITNESLSIHPTGEVWKVDPNQTLAEFNLNFHPVDSSELAPFPLNNVKRGWERHYKEGVMQNSTKVWMHPIRSNQYLLTEIAPFPEVRLPLKAGESWSSELWIYKAFGSFEGTVKAEYIIQPKEKRVYKFGKLDCWKIVAKGLHDRLGESTAVYYFHEEYGFTEMNYSFFNKQKIEFKLTELSR